MNYILNELLNMKKYYISLKTPTFSKQIFMLSYTKEGGIFFKDLVRISAQDKTCMISKITTDVTNHGVRTVKPSYVAFTSGEAKLTHHFDGRAQISGTGVLSGYEKDGTPKGASIRSFPLSSTNNGGPVFTFSAWGIEKACRDTKSNDIILTPETKYIHSLNNDRELNAYIVKGFYILKKPIQEWANSNEIPPIIGFNSPIEGPVELSLVPSPENLPGVIGLLATFGHHGFQDDFGFTLQGAPGYIYNDKFCDGLSIIYPMKGPKDSVGLDYKGD